MCRYSIKSCVFLSHIVLLPHYKHIRYHLLVEVNTLTKLNVYVYHHNSTCWTDIDFWYTVKYINSGVYEISDTQAATVPFFRCIKCYLIQLSTWRIKQKINKFYFISIKTVKYLFLCEIQNTNSSNMHYANPQFYGKPEMVISQWFG